MKNPIHAWVILCFLKTNIYLTALGDGWGPAFIESFTEMKFIRTNAPSLSSGSTFFLGGSTNTAIRNNLFPFDYQTDFTGKTQNRLNYVISVY